MHFSVLVVFRPYMQLVVGNNGIYNKDVFRLLNIEWVKVISKIKTAKIKWNKMQNFTFFLLLISELFSFRGEHLK